MEPEFFDRVLEQVAPLTKSVALHLMGDPLVHPKLSEIVKICEKHETRIFLVTNGLLLRGQEHELLLHPIFQQVNFSLHSFADNFGEKDPTLYLERIFRFTRAAFERRPELYINYRLWNLDANRARLPEHQTVVKAIEAEFSKPIPHVLPAGAKSHHLLNRLYMHFDTEFTWPSLDLPWIGSEGTCKGLTSHIGILADGTVVPCCLDKEGKIPLGNLQESPLKQILSGARAQKILSGFKSGKLTEDLCQRCSYIERFKT